MDICICDVTELECLRAATAPDGPGINQTGGSQLLAPGATSVGPACRSRVKALGSKSKTLHVAVPSAKDRLTLPNVACHALGKATTPESYIDFGGGIIGLSIEHFYVSICCRLSFVQRMLLAYELCGYYTIVPNPDYDEEAKSGEKAYKAKAVARAPLATVERLRTFAKNNPQIRGSKLALKALKYAADSARSPEEARLAIVMLLPHSMGGYGRGPLVMDYRVDAEETLKKCDIFLLIGRIDIEYQSDLYHASRETLRSDSKRANALSALGIPVVTVTSEELRDPEFFHTVMEHVGKLQNRKLRIRTSGFTEKRKALWDALFD